LETWNGWQGCPLPSPCLHDRSILGGRDMHVRCNLPDFRGQKENCEWDRLRMRRDGADKIGGYVDAHFLMLKGKCRVLEDLSDGAGDLACTTRRIKIFPQPAEEWSMSGVERLVNSYGRTMPPMPSGCE